MQFPTIGIRLRMLLLGVVPAILIFAAVLWLNYARMEKMALSLGEEVLLDRVGLVAGEVNLGTQEAVTAARVMAIAAEQGFFGRRKDSLTFARGVLEDLSAPITAMNPTPTGSTARRRIPLPTCRQKPWAGAADSFPIGHGRGETTARSRSHR